MPAVLCSKCATDLPDGAQFCLKCGEPVPSTADGVLPAVLGCAKCGTTLPEGAEFCPKCGKPVSIPSKKALEKPPSGVVNPGSLNATPIEPVEEPTKAWLSWRILLLALLGVCLVAIVWLAASDDPFAQGAQQLAGFKHDQTILDSPFSVTPHNFRYYKFVLPEGSMHVSVVGQFTSSPEGQNAGQKGKDVDNSIEVYVLSETAFTVWQNGYATSSVYQSGRVSEGSMEAEVPPGAGVYYIVFSNKFSPSSSKHVTASMFLRYKNWVPESLRSAKDRFWNWLGI